MFLSEDRMIELRALGRTFPDLEPHQKVDAIKHLHPTEQAFVMGYLEGRRDAAEKFAMDLAGAAA